MEPYGALRDVIYTKKTAHVCQLFSHLFGFSHSLQSVSRIECRTGMDRACFRASLPVQAEKKMLKIKDFITNLWRNP